MDDNGDTVNTITHEAKRGALNKKERRYFEEHFKELGKMRGWSNSVVRDILKKIPKEKVFFDRILLSGTHVFVFRIPDDVAEESSPISVDVFKLNGQFLGATRVPAKPIFISKKRMHFVSSDEEGNIFLVVRE
ncbi:MAG: hypothetical protein GQ544_07915 [Candidatus Aminicenantes bacterium]|nr:hypothetical protein [Candidatus Aminicenantes bacterium]